MGDPAWTGQQQSVIDSCVASGLRRFYFPDPIPGMDSPPDWSFLKPTATLALLNNTSTLPLPDDFGGFEGRITILGVQNQTWWPIDLVNEGLIREKFSQFPAMVSRPLMAAIQPLKNATTVQSQRSQLFFFPTSDNDYTIQFQYYLNPDFLTGAFPYAYGGAQHAETILESCLAVAEERIDNNVGEHAQRFATRLMASIGMDRKSKAQTLGLNDDRSDLRQDQRRWPWQHYSDSIFVGGHLY